MNPETRAARDRLARYADALDHERATLSDVKPFYVDGRIDERHGTDGNTHVLYRSDIRAVLAALDQQPSVLVTAPPHVTDEQLAAFREAWDEARLGPIRIERARDVRAEDRSDD